MDKKILCVGRAHDDFLELHFQGKRPMLPCRESDVLTVDELDQIEDYEADILDREDWSRGQW
jgi:hypothetical protein